MSAIRAASKAVDEDETFDDWSEEDMERFLFPLKAQHAELAKFFTSSWFARLWVVQEVLLAQTCVALYGMLTTSLASVIQLGYTVNVTSQTIQNLPSRDPLTACTYFLTSKHFTRRESKGNHAVSLLSIVRSK